MVNRNRLPRWVNGAIDAIADSPTSLVGRIAARRLGLVGRGLKLTTEHFKRATQVGEQLSLFA